jgi:hypothetical protein
MIEENIVIPGNEIAEIKELATTQNKKIILGNGIRFVYKFHMFI